MQTASAPSDQGRDRPGRVAGDRRLLQRYREHGDLAARDELFARLMPLARQLALRYRRTREPDDDLLQVASLGLVKAIDRFDLDRGTALSTFAVPTILGELRRYFRDHTWSVRVKRDVKERVLRIEGEAARLSSLLGRSPSVAELAGALGLTDEEVLEAMQAARAYDAASLDERLELARPESGASLMDLLGEEDRRLELVEEGTAVQDAMDALDDRERCILYLRFVKDRTQLEIADALGISQMHVSRLLRGALATLRERATADAPV
jgi:RNA polymerase sigma-B factor